MATTGPYRTLDDLIRETLKNLGVLAAGQPPDPEDYAYVNEKVDGILRTLAALAIVYIPDSNNIPALFFDPLASIMAGECCVKFGSTPEDAVVLQGNGLGAPGQPPAAGPGTGKAAKILREINRGRPTYEPLAVDFF